MLNRPAPWVPVTPHGHIGTTFPVLTERHAQRPGTPPPDFSHGIFLEDAQRSLSASGPFVSGTSSRTEKPTLFTPFQRRRMKAMRRMSVTLVYGTVAV